MTKWSKRSIEEIVLSLNSFDDRVVGFVSPQRDAAAGQVVHETAMYMADSRRRVLLIDIGQVVRTGAYTLHDGFDVLAGKGVVHRTQNLDLITFSPTPQDWYALANRARLKEVLRKHLQQYEFVLLALGPVLPDDEHTMSGLAGAAACDAVLLVCCRNRTTRAVLRATSEKLRAAETRVAGIVLNESSYVSVGSEIAATASRVLRPVPRLRRAVQRWALGSDLLT